MAQTVSGGPSTPKAQQTTVPQTSGSVAAQQYTSGSAGNTSTVNTLNSTVNISGDYRGSVPGPKLGQGPLTLSIADAVRRGLEYNLGGVTAGIEVRVARAQRLAALSRMLPNIYGTLDETGAKIDLQTEGLSGAVLGGALPTTIGPFHYYRALANVNQDLTASPRFTISANRRRRSMRRE